MGISEDWAAAEVQCTTWHQRVYGKCRAAAQIGFEAMDGA